MTETIISEELPQIKIQTDRGEIILELFEDEAPNTVANMISPVSYTHLTLPTIYSV